MKRSIADDIIYYKNKITGETVFSEKDPKVFWIDGKQFLEIIDVKRRRLKIAADCLSRMKNKPKL
jgi:hypothetical protein